MSKWNYEDEWFEEGNIVETLAQFLCSKKYEVRYIKDKRKRGKDIVAEKKGKKLVIEVKGYPSDKYVSGKKKGKKKKTNPRLQAIHWFSSVMFQVIKAKNEDTGISIGIGLPKFERYLDLIDSVDHFRQQYKVDFYLVDDKQQVSILSHTEQL